MEMSTEEMLWAGLQAGPVHVLQNTSEGRGESEAERETKRASQKDQLTSTLGLAAL